MEAIAIRLEAITNNKKLLGWMGGLIDQMNEVDYGNYGGNVIYTVSTYLYKLCLLFLQFLLVLFPSILRLQHQ